MINDTYRHPIRRVFFHWWSIIDRLITPTNFQIVMTMKMVPASGNGQELHIPIPALNCQHVALSLWRTRAETWHSIYEQDKITNICTSTHTAPTKERHPLHQSSKSVANSPNHQIIINALQFKKWRNIWRGLYNNIVSLFRLLFVLSHGDDKRTGANLSR